LSDIGGLWRNSVHPQDQSKLDELRNATQHRRPFSVQYRIAHDDGSIRWIWDQGFPVDENGETSSYAGVAEDITDLREAQERLLRSERLAAVGEAITGLAHESRNALQRSQACLEMLTKRVQQQPEAVSLAERGQAALRELHRLYDRLRRFAAPIVLEYESVSVRDVWDSAANDLREIVDQHHVSFDHRGCCTPAETYCQADELALRQVFRNLIDNAIESVVHAHHSIEPRITVDWTDTVFRHGPAIRIVVRDNGPGIESSIRDKIFTPFTTGKANGTGLGLCIARRLVEAHQGRIELAEQDSDSGCEIEILLPRRKPCDKPD
jgi:signal transduction histidine kinase